MDKKLGRMRRARKTRRHIRELDIYRLCVHRTPRHIYAQVIAPNGAQVVASASTLDGQVKEAVTGYSGNVSAAVLVGKFIAERAQAAGVTSVAFDRSGFQYHGRVRALAEAAREHGLQF